MAWRSWRSTTSPTPGLLPGTVHTPMERHAIRSAELALAACDRDWIPVHRSWRLNGRHYGGLQGMDKAQAGAEFGEQQVQLWRRSYAVAPPLAEAEYGRFADPRYTALPPEARPRGESLRDATARLLPYWYDSIIPCLRLALRAGRLARQHALGAGQAPGCDQRRGIAALNIPNSVPLLYELGPGMWPTSRGRYL